MIAAALALTPLLSPLPPPRQDAPAPVPQARIDAAIDRGAAFLAQAFTPDPGRRGRRPKAPKERSGLRALSLYTLLKAGTPHEHPAVVQLLTGLGAEPLDQTYDAACTLLALFAHDPIAHRPWIERLAARLVGWQEESGEWGYPGLIVDLSNTQYAALGLWAAAQAGVEVAPEVWARLAAAVLRFQDSAGGFGYTPGGEGGTGSMTAAGVGTLALCEIHLRRAGALEPALAERMEVARARGQAWLAERFAVDTNPRSGAWLYYYLYGLERAGALVGAREFGTHDWYEAGARFLVDGQAEDGAWEHGSDLSDTCFAVLFLRRATAGEPGPRRPLTGGGRRLDPEGEAAPRGPVWLMAEGAGPVTLTIEGLDPAAAGPLEHDGERGLGPRVERVEYEADGALVGVVLGDPTRPARGAPFALRWVPARAGEVQVVARLFARPPQGGAAVALESAPRAVTVARALPAWLAQQPPDLGPELAAGFRPSASASSTLRGDDALLGLEFEPDLACDGLLRTAWLAKPGDEKRALKISYRKPEAVDVVRVWPAVWSAGGEAFLSRPVEVELALNGGKRTTRRLEVGFGQPAVFELDSSTRIKRLDVRILEVEAGAHPAVGVGEVELFARP